MVVYAVQRNHVEQTTIDRPPWKQFAPIAVAVYVQLQAVLATSAMRAGLPGDSISPTITIIMTSFGARLTIA